MFTFSFQFDKVIVGASFRHCSGMRSRIIFSCIFLLLISGRGSASSEIVCMALTQNELEEAFKKSDEAILSQVYAVGLREVKKYVLANSGSADDARDVFQDAMTIVWLNIQNGKYRIQNDSSLQAYLVQIARYKWLDKLKAHNTKYKVGLSDNMANFLSDEVFEEDGRLKYLQKLYGGLGEKCRQILDLFYYENKSLDEIGSRLNYDAASIRTMKYRCMMQLRNMHLETENKS